MSARLKSQLPLLKVIQGASPKLRKTLLENLNKETLRCLCDCCHNILSGNIPLNPSQRKQLFRHRSTLRKLGTKGLSLRSKKRILVQKGGFVSALLTPLLGVAATLLAAWIQR